MSPTPLHVIPFVLVLLVAFGFLCRWGVKADDERRAARMPVLVVFIPINVEPLLVAMRQVEEAMKRVAVSFEATGRAMAKTLAASGHSFEEISRKQG